MKTNRAEPSERATSEQPCERIPAGQPTTSRSHGTNQFDERLVAASWNKDAPATEQDHTAYRIALGKHLELSSRLAFTEVWYERAVQHGDTYRFNVTDQTTGEERRISELDVHRRAARAPNDSAPWTVPLVNRYSRVTFRVTAKPSNQLLDAQEAKIAMFGKDVGSQRGNVAQIERLIARRFENPAGKRLTPIMSRQTLSELQKQAIRLNLPERVSELEQLRAALAREYRGPTRHRRRSGNSDWSGKRRAS